MFLSVGTGAGMQFIPGSGCAPDFMHGSTEDE